MADKALRFVLSAVDKSAGKTIGDVATKSETASKRITSSFSRIGAGIGSALGGEVGEVVNKLTEGFDKLGESGGAKLGERLAIGGAAAAGLGASLTLMGAAEKQASDQLANAIQNTGHSVEEFEKPIESTVSHMEDFGHSAATTKQSLQTLVNATHDPKQAISLMGEAADLAASKHMSLTSAATQLARVIGGKGARTLAQYNIDLVKNKDGTTDWVKTNEALAKVLNGQASAAADNFGSKLKALTTKVEDNVAEFGQKWGPAITTAGVGLIVLGPLVSGAAKLLSGLRARFGEVGAAATASSIEIGESVSAEEAYAIQVQAWAAQEAAAVARAKAEEAAAASEAAASIAASTAEVESILAEGAASSAEAAAAFAVAMQAEADAAAASAAEITATAEAASASVEEAGVAAGIGWGAMLGPVGLAAGVLGGLALAFHNADDQSELARQASDSYRTSVEKTTDALAAANVEQTHKNLADAGALGTLKDLNSANADLKLSTDDLTNAVNGSEKKYDDFIAKLREAAGVSQHVFDLDRKNPGLTGDKYAELANQVTTYRKGLEAQIETQKELTAAQREYEAGTLGGAAAASKQAAGLGTTTNALLDAKAASDKNTASEKANTLQMQLENDAAGLLKAGLDALNDKTLSAAEAGDRFKDSVAAQTDLLKQNGRTLDDDTTKGRANRAGIYQSIEAAQAHAEAIGKQTGSTEKATAAYQADIGALKAHLLHLGYDKDMVDKIIKRYGAIPPVVKTKVDLADDATAKIAGIEHELYNLTHSHYQVTVDAAGGYDYRTSGGQRFNAGGTDFFSGGATMVAERETEIIAPRGASITPASKMHGGGNVVHLTVNVDVAGPVTPSRQMGEQIGRHVEVYLASGGRIRGL